MFCPNCGAKTPDGAGYCQKCGAKLTVDTAAQRLTETPVQQARLDNTPSDPPKKKKFKKWPIILGVAALAVVVIIFVVINWDGKIDYEATVRAYTPFAVSQGLPYSCGEVFDKYIPGAKWDIRTSNNHTADVDIIGTAKGTDKKLVVTMHVEIIDDRATITPDSVTVDGRTTSDRDEVDILFLSFFAAYHEKYDDLSNFVELVYEVEAALRGDINSTEANTNDFTGNAQGAYAEKVRELASENDALLFSLIDLTGNDVPELVAELPGYYVSIFAWEDGQVYPLGGEYWPYGMGGNNGYEYLPGENLIRNFNSDYAGAVIYESYYSINFAHELSALPNDQLSIRYFRDTNGNGSPDDNEPFLEDPLYYVGDIEVSEDVYASYQISGNYQWISGNQSEKEILSQLESGMS